MSNKNSFGIDFGSIGDAMKDLQDAYSGGLNAMIETKEEVVKDVEPSHKIVVDVKVSARIESHDYKVDAKFVFLADLNSILGAEGGDISSLFGGLGFELGEDEADQVVEQLGKPRCVGKLDDVIIKKIKLHSEKGEVKEGVNKNGTILLTLDNDKIRASFESVFALPEIQAKEMIYYAIPSQEKMEKNVTFDINNLNKKVLFKWKEGDKDSLKVEGLAKIREL